MLKKNYTSQFRKDYKIAIKRGQDVRLLDEVIRQLCIPSALPEKNKDHFLAGNWKGYRECHIQPNWLLLYYYEGNDMVVFARTGTDLLELSELENIDVRLLLSLKGLNRKATCQFQSKQNDEDLLLSQVNALENLLQLSLKSITVEPVLGFYHSSDFHSACLCFHDHLRAICNGTRVLIGLRVKAA